MINLGISIMEAVALAAILYSIYYLSKLSLCLWKSAVRNKSEKVEAIGISLITLMLIGLVVFILGMILIYH
jgi:hypothetical protein